MGTDSSYLAIVILLGLGAVICAVMVTASWLFGPKRPTPYKLATYESGVTPFGNARERFPVKFYLVAMLFIIFDIESIFLYPWYAVFNNPNAFINPATGQPDIALWEQFKLFTFIEVTVFMVFLVAGYLYILRKGALEWNDPNDEFEAASKPGMIKQIATPADGDLPVGAQLQEGR